MGPGGGEQSGRSKGMRGVGSRDGSSAVSRGGFMAGPRSGVYMGIHKCALCGTWVVDLGVAGEEQVGARLVGVDE